MKEWCEKFNISLPECNMCGTCCCCASPSVSYKELLKKASSEEGEKFARDFLSIFVPYESIDEAGKFFPDIVERILKAAQKEQSKIKPEDIVFYKCRYYSEEKHCLVYEDRPLLCRDFPGSPYTVLSKKCGFYNWAIECREKYEKLKEELEILKKYKEELNNLKYQEKAMYLNYKIKNIPEEYKFLWLCPSMSLVSPGKSWIKI